VTAQDLGPVKTITEHASIPASEGYAFSLRCPKGHRPLTGGGYVLANEGALTGSYLAGTTWVVLVRGAQGSPASASVYCLSANTGKPETG
jgi:hypothetical protein